MSKLSKVNYLMLSACALLLMPILAARAAAPTVPTNLTATSATPISVILNWSASTDDDAVAGYHVYRDGAIAPIATTTAGVLTYTDQGLAVFSTHTYALTAFDLVNNESAQSSSTTITTLADTSAPSMPTNLTATAASSSQINLSWTAATDNVAVTGYKIYQGLSQIATTSSISYQNTGLSASTTYIYNVSAFDAAGNVSGLSSSSSATTFAAATPPLTTITPNIKIVGNEGAGRMINLQSNAKIKVIVYASSNFNPKDIVLSSVTLAGAPADSNWRFDYNYDRKTDRVFDFRAKQMVDLINRAASGTMPITFKAVTTGGRQISYTVNVRVKNHQAWKNDREKENKLKEAQKKLLEAQKKALEAQKKATEKAKEMIKNHQKKINEANKAIKIIKDNLKQEIKEIKKKVKENDKD